MAKKKSISLINKIEEKPFQYIIGSFIVGVSVSTTVWNIIYQYHIGNVEERYEDKIENLKKSYEQDIEIARQQEKLNNYIELSPDKINKVDFVKAYNNIKNSKK